MATITASWTKLSTASQLQRSSHSVSAVNSTLHIFGGELKPREPRDNDLHIVSLAHGQDVSISSLPGSDTTPTARVGTASTVIDDKIYLFSGRGGPAMAPVDESGSLWIFDTKSQSWSNVKPKSSAYPEARSYHAMTSDGTSKVYLHAGCPESGRRNDFWSFDVASSEWKELPSAPGPARGGTSIAFAESKVWRMNGFDGEKEVGGSLDFFDPQTGKWDTKTFFADGKSGPGARSVGALVPVKVQGQTWLITLFGERDPSSEGHLGAGKMLGDVWAYDLEGGKWAQVLAMSTSGEAPDARGWFDADVVEFGGKDAVAVTGGLGEENNRLDDLWVLTFDDE
ncbi:unnamed protein product [Zymoseptoria tritici ST99CH_3D1]|nr:unnamed protein product [Zymoseptoria tritici ST99CH_3D1]